MADAFAQDVEEMRQDAAAAKPAPSEDPAKIIEAKRAELAPIEQNFSKNTADLQSVKPPPPLKTPDAPSGPLVDPGEYQKFSLGLIAMALFGGAVSHGNWLGVGAALNGALKGHLEGDEARAQEEWKRYEAAYKKAEGDHAAQQKEYEDILNNKRLSLSEIKTQMQIVAAKYDDQYMLAQAREGRYDGMRKTVAQMDLQREKLGLERQKMNEKLGGAIGPLDQGIIAAIAHGAPLTQMIPGYGNAAIKERQRYRDAAIAQIVQETGKSEGEAGLEFARREMEFAAGKGSLLQQTKMINATQSAVAQLDLNVDNVTNLLKKMPGADVSPVVNAIVRGEQKWTGDPKYSQLFFFMSAAATESARIQSGGQASIAQLAEGARNKAEEWANVNMTPKSWIEGIGPAMKLEGHQRLQSFQVGMDYASRLPGEGGAPPSHPISGGSNGPQIGEIDNGFRYKGGPPGDQNSWEKVQ